MAQGDAQKEMADSAWAVFYARYSEWLWAKCYRVAERLGGITWAKDIFYDRLRGHHDEITVNEQTWATMDVEQRSETTEEDVEVSPRQKAFREAFDVLSEREQTVLRVTAQFYRLGAKAQRLPNKVANELATQLRVTSEGIRAIRSRAMRKLRAQLTPCLLQNATQPTTSA